MTTRADSGTADKAGTGAAKLETNQHYSSHRDNTTVASCWSLGRIDDRRSVSVKSSAKFTDVSQQQVM